MRERPAEHLAKAPSGPCRNSIEQVADERAFHSKYFFEPEPIRDYAARMDPFDELRAMIEAHGWAVRNVSDADPAKCLSYTVGLTAHGHPEVVMTGLPPKVGSAFLNIVGDIVVREGGEFRAEEVTTELADGPAMPVIEVSDKSDLTAVDAIYGDVQAVQIVWTDSAGRLPWEPGYANPPGSQRLLGSL